MDASLPKTAGMVKQQCPHCAATVVADAGRVTCAWCGTNFDPAGGASEVPAGPLGGSKGDAIGIPLASAAQGSPGKQSAANRVMLQVGGALLFSGLWQIGNTALFMGFAEKFPNVADVGIVALQFLPYVAVLAALVMAVALYGPCRRKGLRYREVLEIWAVALVYGITLWIFVFNLSMRFGNSGIWEVCLALIQMLAGMVLIFLASA